MSWNGECVDDSAASSGNPRILPYEVKPITNLTPAKCIGTCRGDGYSFAGVQNAESCFCGNVAPPPNKIVALGECDMGCTGDTSIKCGGSWRMNVYNTEGILSFFLISRHVKFLSMSDSDINRKNIKG